MALKKHRRFVSSGELVVRLREVVRAIFHPWKELQTKISPHESAPAEDALFDYLKKKGLGDRQLKIAAWMAGAPLALNIVFEGFLKRVITDPELVGGWPVGIWIWFLAMAVSMAVACSLLLLFNACSVAITESAPVLSLREKAKEFGSVLWQTENLVKIVLVLVILFLLTLLWNWVTYSPPITRPF